jgi:nucleoside-diphosphate-sugar epimerase
MEDEAMPSRNREPISDGKPPLKNVLVTGAGGLIGGAVLERLVQEGCGVVGLDRNVPAALGANASWVQVDLASSQAPSRLAELSGIEAVIHCAAVIPSSFSGDSSRKAAEINRTIDQHVLDYCQAKDIRMIYCSGTAVYGISPSGLIREDQPVDNSFSTYITEKIHAEGQIREKIKSHAILRICAPYGPSQSASTVLRKFIETAISGGALCYHGSGSREQVFVHVRDVASALAAAVHHPAASGVFNIAGASPITMKELALLVARVVGNPSVVVKASDQEDPQENYRPRFDISRAEAILGWRPVISLEQGIREWVKAAATKTR